MNITKCNNGHFYNSEKYTECPHCKEKINIINEDKINKSWTRNAYNDMPETIAYREEVDTSTTVAYREVADTSTTVAYKEVADTSTTVAYREAADTSTTVAYKEVADTSTTVAYKESVVQTNESEDNKIVIGWLVGISGLVYGKAYNLYIEETNVKDCVVGYNIPTHQFYLNYIKSKGFLYVNGYEVQECLYLNYMDTIIIQGNEYMLIPLCKDGFSWWVEDDNHDNWQSQTGNGLYSQNTILSIDEAMNGR